MLESQSLAMMRRAVWTAVIVCASPLSLVARQGIGADTLMLPAEDTSFAKAIVARVGPKTITGKEFLLAYEFGPAFPKREKDSKRRFLGYMINEKLLALDAEEQGGDAQGTVIRSVGEIVHDLATEELYRQDVLRKVHIGREELREAVAAQRVHYSLRWIYAPTQERIEAYHVRLAKGETFDTVFHAALGDSVTPDDRSWETTRFKLATTRPEIARVADTLKPGRPSAPIEGPDGWYILSVGNIVIDAVTTETDAAQQLRSAKEVLTQHEADSLSDIYVDRIMRGHAPVIERQTFGILCAALSQVWLPEELRKSMFSVLPVDREILLAAATDPRRYAKEPLVTMNDRAVTLGRFLSWYDARSTLVKLRATSVSAYQRSLEQLVWQMVRDGLLIERAEKRHLDKSPAVREQKAWWKDKILFAFEKQKMSETITATDSLLSGYYQTHRARYARELGDTVSYGGALDNVRRDYVSEQMRARMLHRLLALRRKYPVNIADDVLAALPVDSENDPRAIDVYFAKKGGTFPHPAFPTIDYDWQTWE